MPTHKSPGVYVEEIPSGARTIAGLNTSNTAFVGFFKRGPRIKPMRITSLGEFDREFGGLDANSDASYGIQQYYQNGGQVSWVVRCDGSGPDSTALSKGIHSLDKIAPHIFNILCLPAVANLSASDFTSVISDAEEYCADKRAFLLVDIPRTVASPNDMATWIANNDELRHRNAAVYFPRLEIQDALNRNRLKNVGASGTMAGIYARTDASRGVWKAPAGIEAVLRGVELTHILNDQDSGELNRLGINSLRKFPEYGNISWGSRTLEGSDFQSSDWKYIPVRRLALFLEESLYQGLRWVVFEPNDEPLWSQIRLIVGAFMNNLFRAGAFQGRTPQEAYFVKCDSETTTPMDIALGIVKIIVGFAPLKPAEFVIIKIKLIAVQEQV
jgi:phage tail sheath protein FI